MSQNCACSPSKCTALSWCAPFASKWYSKMDPSCATFRVLCLCQVVGTHWSSPDCRVLSEIHFLNNRNATSDATPIKQATAFKILTPPVKDLGNIFHRGGMHFKLISSSSISTNQTMGWRNSYTPHGKLEKFTRGGVNSKRIHSFEHSIWNTNPSVL